MKRVLAIVLGSALAGLLINANAHGTKTLTISDFFGGFEASGICTELRL